MEMAFVIWTNTSPSQGSRAHEQKISDRLGYKLQNKITEQYYHRSNRIFCLYARSTYSQSGRTLHIQGYSTRSSDELIIFLIPAYNGGEYFLSFFRIIKHTSFTYSIAYLRIGAFTSNKLPTIATVGACNIGKTATIMG